MWILSGIFVMLYSSFVRAETRNFSHQPKIAIIGAGIGGTSAAYFLSNMKGFEPKIDVYSKDAIGGRLATVTVAGYEYETGGSILHSRNKYMKAFADKFGLHAKRGISGKFGLFDGSKFTYKQGNWEIINLFSLLLRYGLSIIKINSLIEDMLTKFERIYKLQDEGTTFNNISELLWAMDPSFVDMLEHSLDSGLKEEGIADLFIQELAMAIMRVNYGQSVEAHQFVGSVSLAGAESNLWSIQGGNKKVPIALLNASGAHFHQNQVETISLTSDNKFALYTKEAKNAPVIYDAVIVATPLSLNTSPLLQFTNFPTRFHFPGSFHRIVCTLIHGEVNYDTFGLIDEASIVDEIFTTNTSLFFNSLSRNYPVDLDDGTEDLPSVWKVFSNEPLNPEQLDSLFHVVHEMKVVDWKAYPEYEGMAIIAGENFTLYPGLSYINTIEWAASAMEMSVIGARNVALLTANFLGVTVHDSTVKGNSHIEL